MSLALLVVAWLAGIFLGLGWEVAPLPLLLLGLAALALGALLRLLRWSPWPALLVLALLLGLLRVELGQGPAAPLVIQDRQTVSMRGWVSDDPEATSRSIKFELTLEAIDRGGGWQPVPGKALVYASPPDALVSARAAPYYRYGDRLQLQGSWQRPQPFADFDYPAYLESQGISGVFWSRQAEWLGPGAGHRWQGWVFDTRRWLSGGLERSLPVPQSSLAQALLLGLRGPLPEEVAADFRNTGAAHLLAISGLHVGMLLAMFLGLGGWLLGKQRRSYLLLPLGAIWLYALLSGLPPSAARAALMGSLYLAALFLGRPGSTLAALAGSAGLLTALEPRALTQVSFQLSFAAMAGIILALPYQSAVAARVLVAAGGNGGWWGRWRGRLLAAVVSGVIVSVAATLATLPLVAFNFRQIPLLGIPVTLLALPVLPVALGSAALTALLGSVHPLPGQLAGWAAWLPLTYLLKLVSLAPAATLSGTWVGPPLVWGWYLGLVALLLGANRRRQLKRLRDRLASGQLRPTPVTGQLLGVGVALGIASVVLWVQVLSGPDGELHVYFLDVGQGDSIFIVTPGGRQLLIDGGPDTESATGALSGPLAFWDRTLDLVALTHLDADHSRGLLEALDRFRTGGVLVGADDPGHIMYPRWRAELDRGKLREIHLSRGYRVELEEGVSLTVLHPPPETLPGPLSSPNNNGLVLRLSYGEVSFLLTGDIEAEAERYLLRVTPDLTSRVLKVAHHGSRTSTTPEFLRGVNPELAVISAGTDNPHGHPHPEVVARLVDSLGEGQVYQTAVNGTVEVITDGRTLRVVTER